MNAVILAAGVGKRLYPHTLRRPKCLLTFGGKTLLQRHIESLGNLGLNQITIVIGHLAEQVKKEVARSSCEAPIQLIYNSDFEKGSALSLYRAEEIYKHEPALIMDADILCERTMFKRLLNAPPSNCLLVDEKLVDTGEEVKVVILGDGRVRELGKQITGSGRVIGESVGIYKFTPQASQVIAQELRQAVKADPYIEYEPVFNRVLNQLQMGYVTVSDLPWIEIDFPEDLERAQGEVWPLIQRLEKPAPTRIRPV